MSEITGRSAESYSVDMSDCETVSSAPSRPSSPDTRENLFMSVATLSMPRRSDPFCIRYEHPTRSTEFWFEDGSAAIEVENTLYNVHGSILKRQSSFFRENLPSPWTSLSTDIHAPTGSPQQPLVLGVAKLDFELLLSLIYPSDYWSRHNFTVEEWFRIASVATELEFKSIRKAALQNIFDNTGALELIDLGGKHNMEECISYGVRMLCFADEPLCVKDGEAIGMELVIQIARARELLAKGTKWSDLERDVSSECYRATVAN